MNFKLYTDDEYRSTIRLEFTLDPRDMACAIAMIERVVTYESTKYSDEWSIDEELTKETIDKEVRVAFENFGWQAIGAEYAPVELIDEIENRIRKQYNLEEK